jgi:hypothetical protein
MTHLRQLRWLGDGAGIIKYHLKTKFLLRGRAHCSHLASNEILCNEAADIENRFKPLQQKEIQLENQSNKCN